VYKCDPNLPVTFPPVDHIAFWPAVPPCDDSVCASGFLVRGAGRIRKHIG